MRTIKFKGKSLMNGQWVSGDLVHSLLDGKSNIFGFTGAHQIDPTTVCQFTGFLDKNGKEIYEGDILRSDEYPFSCMEDDARDNYFGIIEWSDEEAMFLLTCVKTRNPLCVAFLTASLTKSRNRNLRTVSWSAASMIRNGRRS